MINVVGYLIYEKNRKSDLKKKNCSKTGDTMSKAC